MRIGLFDSGLGGLTVLKELKKEYPNNEYIYFGDNINMPYGEKTKDQLIALSTSAVEFLISKNVDIIIIACGTVSSNVYNELVDIYDIKIYDIISPTINYINNSDFKKIGLIATPATVSSNQFKNRINKDFIQQSCPLLVPFIEKNISIDIDEALSDYLNGMDVDALILGCTHYPILEKEIRKHTTAKLINMGKVLCKSINVTSSRENVELYFSDCNDSLNKINEILDFKYTINKK